MPDTFENLDWEKEAVKIANAFLLPQGCEFRGDRVRTLVEPLTVQSHFDMGDGWVLQVHYSQWGRDFCLGNARYVDNDGSIPKEEVRLLWDDTVSGANKLHEEAKAIFVKAFYFMGESVSDISSVFGLSITAHELLEWELERDGVKA